MRKITFAVVALSAVYLTSCCGCGTGSSDDSDSTHVDAHGHESHESHEEESTLAFDGVAKGDYTLYGHSEITPDGAVTITEMYKSMETNGAFNGKVSVSIAEVCQKAGCWITFNDDNGTEVRVFFRDHFTIPIETEIGTEAILYGSLVVDTLSVDFQKHLLDDAKEAGHEVAQSEYDAIIGDKIEKTFDCESILVKY